MAQSDQGSGHPPSLSNSAWVSIPNSAMNTVFVPGVDDVFKKAPNSWRMIQEAWSGGVCVGDEMFVWGGGHGDGAHNGLLAVNVKNGKWRRLTEPSPLWTEELCPEGVCPAKTGDCGLRECNTGPDGRPVARHTYYLLASDGRSIYSIGGGKWPGGGGAPPRAWKFDLAQGEWSPLKNDSPVTKPHGSVVYAQEKLYHTTADGFAILDIATGEWRVTGKGVPGVSGLTGVVYVPTLDRLFALGNGKAWFTERSEWGRSARPIPTPPAMLEGRYLGLTYYPPEDRILIWDGGRSITTLDPRTNNWGEITPAGDPGPRLTNGTFSRFSYCGERVVLVDGAKRDLFYLAGELPTDVASATSASVPVEEGASPPEGPERKATTERSTVARAKAKAKPKEPKANRKRREPDSPPDLRKSPSSAVAPYYATPPGDRLVEEQCGPVASWDIVDVRTNEAMEGLRRLVPGKRTVARIHWKSEPYPLAYVKGAECLKLEGIPGPNGEKPLVGGVNGTRAWMGTIRKGGILIEGLEISPGKVAQSHPELEINVNCLGIPNDQMFFILRNSYVGRCGHHAFITGHAHHLYLEVAGSHFEQASSHLAYIDHIAMAYIHDSTFQSPGWGHALRCIALRCIIERVRVSNVQLDGTTLPRGGDNPLQPKRTYIGMHPFEIYTCGENEIRDVEIVFRSEPDRNGRFAAILRGREAFNTCDVGEVVDGAWTPLLWGEPDFARPERWATVTPLRTRVDGMKITCAGTEPCAGWSVRGSYPTMDDEQKAALQVWLKSRTFASWDDLRAQIPPEKPEWRWLSEVVLPGHRSAFMEGRITNKVPLPVPVPGWFQRAELVLKNVSVDRGGVLVSPEDPDAYCYGVPPVAHGSDNASIECPDQYDGLRFRQAQVTVLP